MLASTVRTSTTAVPRIVGDPLPPWVVVAAGLALLAAIVVASLLVRRRMVADQPPGRATSG